MYTRGLKHLRGIINRFGITLQTFKISLAAGISWGLASLFTPHFYPYIAPLTAVLIVNTTLAKSVTKALNRLYGIIGGVGSCLFITHWIQPSAIAVFFSIFIGMTIATIFKLHQDSISQIGVTVVMVLAFMHSGGYEWGRILETIIGAFVAILITVLPFSKLNSLLNQHFDSKNNKHI
ncbi:FUSC family protein [Heyndrickxia ginsengihumi]|uniref:FUSC family protein n=1 Tax=Heyndrickxia ginsengihumi TaxID=363870 RepID=UPI00068BCFFE|nr:FUSC family protein [Heyndrickxia ginsengihumi]